ncbi:gag-asp_proteas domain-containing protein [Gossypium australe]|uniref:Gag-asp_proteas domain-containing protein n=1 Tax=Gossypium australe TaxID=47621 RepID=A0A5B6WRY1_9ROSI|nr:gag-asp_proteas domain-containing protein [Gossypium australe]
MVKEPIRPNCGEKEVGEKDESIRTLSVGDGNCSPPPLPPSLKLIPFSSYLEKKKKRDDNEFIDFLKIFKALNDPDSFTIPIDIGGVSFGKALCDLSASINLMPLSIYRRLGLGELKEIEVTLQLAN